MISNESRRRVKQIIDKKTQSYTGKDFYLGIVRSLNYLVFDLKAAGSDFNKYQIIQFGRVAVDYIKADEANLFW
jgi:hypothetical protein